MQQLTMCSWLLHDNADQEDWYSEFDIIEGVSKNSWNELSIHTAQMPCKMRDNGGTGQTRDDLECSSGHNCGVNGPDGSFGQAFNDRHGGVWAAEVSNGGIKAWFFARGSEPSGLDGDHPDPSRWGKPVMNFVGDGCDIQKTLEKDKKRNARVTRRSDAESLNHIDYLPVHIPSRLVREGSGKERLRVVK